MNEQHVQLFLFHPFLYPFMFFIVINHISCLNGHIPINIIAVIIIT